MQRIKEEGLRRGEHGIALGETLCRRCALEGRDGVQDGYVALDLEKASANDSHTAPGVARHQHQSGREGQTGHAARQGGPTGPRPMREDLWAPPRPISGFGGTPW